MANDVLFGCIEQWQQGSPWGRVLDAGTGKSSLGWLVSLPTENWTAVTGADAFVTSLKHLYGSKIRAHDRLLLGNWRDPSLLAQERFDVVVADYLIGAIDGFAPYYQDCILERLRPLVTQHLYIIGLEPYPDKAREPGAELILEIARMRDACILLAGHRCYREYPLDCLKRNLERAGFAVTQTKRFPIQYSERFVQGQLDVCRRKLALFHEPKLAASMRYAIDDLQRRAMTHIARCGKIRFGEDYVVQATPVQSI